MRGKREKERELERLLRRAAASLAKRPPAPAAKPPAEKKTFFGIV